MHAYVHMPQVGCLSPEYTCWAPFQHEQCKPRQDCNYELAQLRWGLHTALDLATRHHLNVSAMGIDRGWWQMLLDSGLAWYPHDDSTGLRLDVDCAFVRNRVDRTRISKK